MDNVDSFIRIIQGVGFPAAVAAFVLVRLEKRLIETREAVTRLSDALIRLTVLMEAKKS